MEHNYKITQKAGRKAGNNSQSVVIGQSDHEQIAALTSQLETCRAIIQDKDQLIATLRMTIELYEKMLKDK
ncbi:hypothetical protein ACO2Q8_04100 [Larkinella sp. VNQ87]|uniref:hypothetical protein n=1 Tax=Larkinella sp. VNQ87 TaxID=3400921 RepID=UPI003BFEE8C4